MSTSPQQPDPYEALGIGKDADCDTIKKAHRKLVLKHHPDRIKDPALVEQGKNEFQKVQRAYELLIDPANRQRYDDECKLAELRRNRMASEPPRSYAKTTYKARPSPGPTQPVPREMNTNGRFAYEERVPDFDVNSPGGYDEPIPRANARKADSPYERRPAPPKAAEKKEKKDTKGSSWDKPAQGMSMRTVFGLKASAQAARTKVKEKETQAQKAKARDQEQRRERAEKNNHRGYSPRVDDYYSDSSSDSDTVVAEPRRPVTRDRSPTPKSRSRNQTPEPTPRRRMASSPQPARRQPSPQPSTRRNLSPQPMPRRPSSPQPAHRRQPSPQPVRRPMYDESDEESDESEDEKWKRYHHETMSYIAASQKQKRPTLSRQNSDAYSYRSSDFPLKDRKSGSEDDRPRATAPRGTPRRSVQEESRLRPPMVPHQNSAPANIKFAASTLDRESMARPRQNSSNTTSHRREMPELKRTGSEPNPPRGPMKRGESMRDNVPAKPSNLSKTETNHDSGYGSSSSPQTPEMRGTSPPGEYHEPTPQQTSRKYKVEKDPVNDAPRARRPDHDDGAELRRFLSPESAEERYRTNEPKPHERERRRSRSRETVEPVSRSRSGRPEAPQRRPSISRTESSAARTEGTHRRMFGELPGDRSAERLPERPKAHTRATIDPSFYSSKSGHKTTPPTSKVFQSHYGDPVYSQSRGSRRPSVY